MANGQWYTICSHLSLVFRIVERKVGGDMSNCQAHGVHKMCIFHYVSKISMDWFKGTNRKPSIFIDFPMKIMGFPCICFP